MSQRYKRSGPAFRRTATAIYEANCSSWHPFQPDLEAHDRVVAVRDLLDAFATGSLIPTTGALANLAGVLVSAARHQRVADLEQREGRRV